MERALQVLTVFLSLVVIASTALPLVRTTAGIVRICDFPRPQILALAVAALIAMSLQFEMTNGWLIALATATLLCVIVQAALIVPYTPLFPKESGNAPSDGASLSLLIANVKVDNRSADPLLRLIGRHDPDIIFLVETDDWWVRQCSEVRARYPHATDLPRDDGYGLIFLSRLPVVSCEVRRLIEPNIPSIRADIRLESGEPFRFYGLHPQPPGPIQDADERNTELLLVAGEIGRDDQPTIVAGDLNDVAWSRTNRRFQRISDLLDPRIGRGMFSTFHADYWFARWPLDHLFHSRHFALRELEVLPHIGSDHFPIKGTLCLVRQGGNQR